MKERTNFKEIQKFGIPRGKLVRMRKEGGVKFLGAWGMIYVSTLYSARLGSPGASNRWVSKTLIFALAPPADACRTSRDCTFLSFIVRWSAQDFRVQITKKPS